MANKQKVPTMLCFCSHSDPDRQQRKCAAYLQTSATAQQCPHDCVRVRARPGWRGGREREMGKEWRFGGRWVTGEAR